MRMTRLGQPPRRIVRKGNILILSAVLMVLLMALLAFAVDLGYMCMARTELQRSADASAIAAAWDLLAEQDRLSGAGLSNAVAQARLSAQEYAAGNQVGTAALSLAQDDVTVKKTIDTAER